MYGEKSAELSRLIEDCQDLVALGGIPDVFTKYDRRQVHLTILGFECADFNQETNGNFKEFRHQDVVMQLDGLLSYLRTCGHFPLVVQIGGFQNREYPFRSRDERPYERSFSIQRD